MIKGKSLKKSLVWLLSLLMVLSILGPATLAAGNNEISVDLRVEGITENQLGKKSVEVEVSSGAPTVMDVLDKASEDGLLSYSEEGGFVTEINGEEIAHFGGWDGWMYKVNRESPDVGAGEYTVEDGDKIVWYYGEMVPGTLIPEITIEPDEPVANEDFTINVTSSYEDWNTGDTVVEEIEDAVVLFEGEEYITDEEGKAVIPGSATPDAGTYSLKVHKDLKHPDSSKEDTFPFIVRTGNIPATVLDAEPDPEEAQVKAVSWYKENHNPPDSWKGMPGLWRAGEDLSASPWETNQEWRDDDYVHGTQTHWHVHYIFKLLSAEEDPSHVWGGTNLFQELSGLQQDNGEFDGYSQAAHPWPVVALDVGKELGLDVGSWDADSQEKAVAYLLTQQSADGSFSMGIDTTGFYLIALSNYMDDPDVEDAIDDALDYLQDKQDDEAFFVESGPWGSKNSNTQAVAISGLVAVGEDVLDPEGDWAKSANTPLSVLLEFQQDDGQFFYQLDNAGAGTMGHDDALVALSCLVSGDSTWHRMGKEIQFDTDPDPEPDPDKVTVNLSVEGIDDTILQKVEVDVESTNDEPTALDALEQGLDAAEIDYELEHYDWGVMITSIDGQAGGYFGGWDGWTYNVNDESPNVGAGVHPVYEDDSVLFYYSRWPEISTDSVIETGDEDPQVEVALVGDEYVEDAENLDSWDIDPGDIGLTVNSITKDGDQQVTISFSETADEGTISIQAKAGALGGDSDSNTVIVPIDVVFQVVEGTPIEETIQEDVENAWLKADTADENGKKIATLPSIDIDVSSSLGVSNISISQKTKVSGPTGWDGSIRFPKVKDNDSVNVDDGNVKAVLEVGFPAGQLDFDKPVRLTIPGQAGKSAGFTRGDEPVTEIDKVLDKDTPEHVADNLVPGEAGKIDVGDDLVIWTTHLTKFVAYTPDEGPSPSPGGGGSSPSPTKEQVTLSVEARTIDEGDIISSTEVDLEDDDTAFSVLEREADERGISISGSANYVSGIDGINEFDHGPLSGWKYEVNGDFPTEGAGEYILSDGDRLRWRYTTDAGEDLGVDPDDAQITPDDEEKEKEDEETEEIKERLTKKGDNAVDWIFKQADLSEPDSHLDWAVFALAQYGEEVPDGYRDLLLEYVADNKGEFRLITDYARIALAAATVGLDPTELVGYDLVKKIYTNEKMTDQGTNGPVFSLIALDSCKHEVPEDALWTRQCLVDWILEQQNKDGSFPLHQEGDSAGEVDVTAMALQALSNYQDQEEVKGAVDKALEWLSEEQLDNGGFESWGEENCETVSQVIIALTALDMDPQGELFVKEEGDLLTSLYSFANEDGGFAHAHGEESNEIATQQALMAITAYQRWVDEKNSLYDMTDEELFVYRDEENISPWAVEYVEKAWEYGLMEGVSDKEPIFEPKRELTRAEIAALLVRLFGIELLEQPEKYFDDVNEEEWHYNYIMSAREEGIVRGVSENKFSPIRSVTREEIAKMLNRTLNFDDSQDVDTGSIKDFHEVSRWAESSVEAVFSNEVMLGDNNYFRPKNPVTREMAAVIMVRVYEDYIK